MLIGLTFIGTSDYQTISYKLNDKIIETNLFPKAFEQFFNFDKLFIIATKSAEEKHYKNCNCKTETELIRIPDGKNEDELWQIFEEIHKKIPEKSNLIIDVTHSFRSLPIIGLSILQYLKTLKQVIIEAIVYGAYEARDENNIAPVFNLTPFINIIDWSYSIYDFVQHGNSQLLKDILVNIQKKSYLEDSKIKPKSISGIGQSLNKLSDALSIVRVKETLSLSEKLFEKIKSVKSEIDEIPQLKPLEPLLSLLNQKFSALKINENELFTPKGFNAQIKMLELYKSNSQYMQAITLAREILVSKIAIILKIDPIDKRDLCEKILNTFDYRFGKFRDYNNDISTISLNNTQKIILKEFVKLWVKVREIRNDINHAGMRKSVSSTNKALKSITDLITQTINLLKKYEQE